MEESLRKMTNAQLIVELSKVGAPVLRFSENLIKNTKKHMNKMCFIRPQSGRTFLNGCWNVVLSRN